MMGRQRAGARESWLSRPTSRSSASRFCGNRALLGRHVLVTVMSASDGQAKLSWEAIAPLADHLPLGEEQGQLGSQLPIWRACWTNDVVIGGYICAHWLIAHFEYSAKTATDRYGPLLTRRCQPVRGNDW